MKWRLYIKYFLSKNKDVKWIQKSKILHILSYFSLSSGWTKNDIRYPMLNFKSEFGMSKFTRIESEKECTFICMLDNIHKSGGKPKIWEKWMKVENREKIKMYFLNENNNLIVYFYSSFAQVTFLFNH